MIPIAENQAPKSTCVKSALIIACDNNRSPPIDYEIVFTEADGHQLTHTTHWFWNDVEHVFNKSWLAFCYVVLCRCDHQWFQVSMDDFQPHIIAFRIFFSNFGQHFGSSTELARISCMICLDARRTGLPMNAKDSSSFRTTILVKNLNMWVSSPS